MTAGISQKSLYSESLATLHVAKRQSIDKLTT